MAMRNIPQQIAARLPAAAELFAERGLNDTKIEDVAAATGIAKATLYYYFAGKEDILAFLLHDTLGEVADEVARAVRGHGSGADRLGGVISAQLRVMARHPDACRALIGELGRAGRMPAIAALISAAYHRPVEALLIEGAADGSLVAQLDARSTALVTDNGLDEVVVTRTIQSIALDGLRPR
jgi:AcrR family transcriptional regulator